MTIPSNRLFAANVIYQLSIVGTSLTLLQIPVNSLIIAYEKMTIYAFQGIYDAAARLVIAYIIVRVTNDHLIVYGILILVVQLSISSFYFIYSNFFGDTVVFRGYYFNCFGAIC